ncbi:MAG: hypothetical protein ACK44N_09275 [Bacteroidota bacterium]|jgi:DNA repair exonuclease SbcCD ATPase subunit
MSLENKESQSKKTIVIVIISLLLGVNGLLLWQFFNKKTDLQQTTVALKNTTAEKETLNAELQKVKFEFDKLNQENAGLQNLLTSKDEEIRSKIAEIQRLINSGDAAQLRKAKDEIANLKQLSQNYIAQIDSLKIANKDLTDQNSSLSQDLSSANSKVGSLTQENSSLSNKVAIASVLKTVNAIASGVKYKGSGKETETTKAKQTDRIKTCFTIIENQVVDKGAKDIYLRIIGPDGTILSTSNETFMLRGQASIYTIRQTIFYENKNTDLCIYWEKGNAYSTGKYAIEIYCEGNQIGSAAVTLK